MKKLKLPACLEPPHPAELVMGVTHAAPCLATVGALRVPASIGTAFAALNWPIKACAKPDTRFCTPQPRRAPPLSPYEAVLCVTGAGNRGSSRATALHLVACEPPHAAVGTERTAWCGGCETSCTRLPGGCEASLQLTSRPLPGWQALRVSGPSCRRLPGGARCFQSCVRTVTQGIGMPIALVARAPLCSYTPAVIAPLIYDDDEGKFLKASPISACTDPRLSAAQQSTCAKCIGIKSRAACLAAVSNTYFGVDEHSCTW